MLAEIFMIWLESLCRQQRAEPSNNTAFVPFDRASFGSFKVAGHKRREQSDLVAEIKMSRRAEDRPGEVPYAA